MRLGVIGRTFLGFFFLLSVAQGQEAPPTTHLYVIFDDSTSMNDFGRIGQAQKAVREIFSKIEDRHELMQISQAGLVPMNARPLFIDFTKPFPKDELSNYAASIHANGGTSIEGPVRTILRQERESSAASIVILAFTDGEMEEGPTLDSLRDLLGDKNFHDVQFRLLKVDDRQDRFVGQDIVKAINNFQVKYRRENPALPVVRTVKAEELKDFAGVEQTMADITRQMLSAGIRFKVKDLFGKDREIDAESGRLRDSLVRADNLLHDVDGAEQRLRQAFEVATGDLDKSIGMLKGQTLSEALAGYAKNIQSVRGFYNDSLLVQLQEFERIVSQINELESRGQSTLTTVAELRKKLQKLEEVAKELKTGHPEEFAALPDEVKRWLEGQSERLKMALDSVATQAVELGKGVKTTSTRIGKVSDSFKSQFSSLRRQGLDRYRDAFVARFGKEKWDELMKAGAESGIYYDRRRDEWVLTGLNYAGGGGHSPTSSGPGIRLRNEGVIIELPGGGSGGTRVTEFTNNGTIIREGMGLRRLQVENDGGYTIFTNNGDIITLASYDIHSKGEFTWARFEKGFLIFRKHYSGQVQQVIYVSDEDFLKIATELESVTSHEEIIAQMVGDDWAWFSKSLSVPGAVVVESLEAASRAGRYFVGPKPGEKAPEYVFDYSTTRQRTGELVDKSRADRARLEKMLSSGSGHLGKFPKSFWNPIFKIMLGPDDGEQLVGPILLPGENHPSPGVAGKAAHSAVSAVEMAAAYRLTLHNTVRRLSGARMPLFSPKPSFAHRVAGGLLRWGTGALLMYDATKRAYLVWRVDVDPTWSPLGTAVFSSSLVQRVQAYVGGDPQSVRKQRQLKADAFFKALEKE